MNLINNLVMNRIANKIFSLISELCMVANMGVVSISSDIENALIYFKKIILLSNKKINIILNLIFLVKN